MHSCNICSLDWTHAHKESWVPLLWLERKHNWRLCNCYDMASCTYHNYLLRGKEGSLPLSLCPRPLAVLFPCRAEIHGKQHGMGVVTTSKAPFPHELFNPAMHAPLVGFWSGKCPGRRMIVCSGHRSQKLLERWKVPSQASVLSASTCMGVYLVSRFINWVNTNWSRQTYLSRIALLADRGSLVFDSCDDIQTICTQGSPAESVNKMSVFLAEAAIACKFIPCSGAWCNHQCSMLHATESMRMKQESEAWARSAGAVLSPDVEIYLCLTFEA